MLIELHHYPLVLNHLTMTLEKVSSLKAVGEFEFHFVIQFLSSVSVVGHQRQLSSCDVAACYYGLGAALLAIAVPALPFILGITALFLRYFTLNLCFIRFYLLVA